MKTPLAAERHCIRQATKQTEAGCPFRAFTMDLARQLVGLAAHHAYAPKVLIYRSGVVYKMKADGVASEIIVQRINLSRAASHGMQPTAPMA